MVLLVATLVLAQQAAEPPTPAGDLIARTTEREYVDQALDDGRHVRFGTNDKGPVHVWRPRFYRRDQAATIIYVHGFFTSVDQAMREHGLTAQFRDSGRNALFIVPEARSWRTDPVFWPDLEELIRTVEKRLRIQRPKGPIIVVGHSGAYKTIVEWLEHERLSQVILMDGLYGNDDEYRAWTNGDGGAPPEQPKQLVLVGFDTQQRTEWFLKKQAVAVKLDTLPYLFDELPPPLKKAPVLSIQSERFDHMQLVTNGKLLPWLLHVLR